MQSFSERSAENTSTSMRSANGLRDQSLVEAARNGHSMAFAALSERYKPQLFRAAHRITRNCQDAEDAVQDALLRAFVHIADFDGRSSFGTWLTRIAINSALMILRKRRASLEINTDHNDELSANGLPHEMTDQGPSSEVRYAQSETEANESNTESTTRPPNRSSNSTIAGTLDAGNRRRNRHLFDCRQRAAGPRQERPPKVDDPETDTPTSIPRKIHNLPAGQWLSRSRDHDCS
jgi:RNA polymerase sigma factor (sigma-70 family)